MESDDYDVEATDDEWIESGKLQAKKRDSRSGRSNMENKQSSNENSNVHDNSREGLPGVFGDTDICCSCTKSSSCKTAKCKCRTMGNICGKSCGCLETKCANRGLVSKEEPAQSEVIEGIENDSSIDETEKDLATHGAELLQSALVKNQTETNNDRRPRKPLADIGNAVVHLVTQAIQIFSCYCMRTIITFYLSLFNFTDVILVWPY